MWYRALRLSEKYDRKYGGVKVTPAMPSESGGANNPLHRGSARQEVVPDLEKANSDQSLGVPRQSSSLRPTDLESNREQQKKSLLHQHYFWLGINVVAYGIIFGTLIGYRNDTEYEVNLICIAILCFVTNVGIFVIGILNWMRLRASMHIVYASGNDRTEQPVHNTFMSRWCGWSAACMNRVLACFCCVESHGNPNVAGRSARLRVQTEVLRIILTVSFVVGIFFLLRSICFMYYPVFQSELHEHWAVAPYIYPWWFYQLPELIPNLTIARGISHPKGILRVAERAFIDCWYYCSQCACCWIPCAAMMMMKSGSGSSHSNSVRGGHHDDGDGAGDDGDGAGGSLSSSTAHGKGSGSARGGGKGGGAAASASASASRSAVDILAHDVRLSRTTESHGPPSEFSTVSELCDLDHHDADDDDDGGNDDHHDRVDSSISSQSSSASHHHPHHHGHPQHHHKHSTARSLPSARTATSASLHSLAFSNLRARAQSHAEGAAASRVHRLADRAISDTLSEKIYSISSFPVPSPASHLSRADDERIEGDVELYVE